MERILIISHSDISKPIRKIQNMYQHSIEALYKYVKWTKVIYENSLWEEFDLLSSVLDKEHGHFNIWDMPLYSGIHLKSLLVKHGIKCNLINYIDQYTKDKIINMIHDFNPDGIIISTTFYLDINHIKMLIKLLRKTLPDTKIIIGGHVVYSEVYANDEGYHSLKDIGNNVYIIGSRYGEKELLNLISGNIKEDDNIIDTNDKSAKTQILHKEIDYDPDKWSIDYSKISLNTEVIPIMTSRGCGFNCSFCSYPTSGGKFIHKKISTVINELKDIQSIGVKHLLFLDDTLNFPIKRFKELLKEMVENGLTTFKCYSFCRCQFLDDETVDLMKKCGFTAVLLGIESGAEEILKNMNKHANITDYKKGIKLLKQYEILTVAAIIVGFPGETLETINKTVDFLNENELDYYYMQQFYFIHNTLINKEKDKYGLSGHGIIWQHNTMDNKQCLAMIDDMSRRVNVPIFVNPNYTLWELVYFFQMGYSKKFYDSYRTMINGIRENNHSELHLNNVQTTQDIRDKYSKDIINSFQDKWGKVRG